MTELEKYVAEHTSPESALLKELDRETNLRMVQPRMISGHVQGRLLKMIVQMVQPRYVLEIGTFTGYSALCMAEGLADVAELHTIEIDDELEGLARSFFARSEYSERIFLHIGSALKIAPELSKKFDLIFIDGDKREYPAYYRMAMEHLVHSGSYIIADNILWYGKVTGETPANDLFSKGIKEFNDMVSADDRVENVILPVRDGLNLIRVK